MGVYISHCACHGGRERVEVGRPSFRGQCFFVPSSKIQGNTRTNQYVLLCLVLQGGGQTKDRHLATSLLICFQ